MRRKGNHKDVLLKSDITLCGETLETGTKHRFQNDLN